MNLYDDPQVYDVLYTPGTARECDVLERIAHRWVRTPAARPVWLEPACGSGRYLRVLARRGHRLQGFDRNAGMVHYARAQAPRARVFTADLLDFAAAVRPQPVDFAFNLFNTIRHLETDAALLLHFAQMAQVLRPGGVYAVGLSFTAYGQELMDEDVWEGRRGALHIRQVAQYLPPGSWEPGQLAARPPRRPRFERVISHMRITRGARVEDVDTHYDLRCYDARQWRSILSRSALQPVATLDMTGRPVTGRPPYALELLALR